MGDDNNISIDDLLNGLFRPSSLRELFDKKLKELEISATTVAGLLDMQNRALNGILDSTMKTVDYTYFIRLSSFLQIPREKVLELYIAGLDARYPTTTITSDKVEFIKENFDLAALRKAGFIDSITDFVQIEQRLLYRLRLKSIFEYRKPNNDVAFSSGLIKPKNELTRSFWIKAAMSALYEIENPNTYNRQGLIEYFPQIRWHCTNIERGLTEVIRSLYKLGITVIYQPPLPTLQLRGATFALDDKPCIVLTNYVDFYSTLWFALIHELYHVLFDWDEIRANLYHLTDDNDDQLSVRQREDLADNFAREYLFSRQKSQDVKRYLNDQEFVQSYANSQHVHASFIYVFAAYDAGSDKRAWGRARKLSPSAKNAIQHIDLPWENVATTELITEERKRQLYS